MGKILVVEDDPAVRKLASEILRGYGYTVHLASSGDEALSIFAGIQES